MGKKKCAEKDYKVPDTPKFEWPKKNALRRIMKIRKTPNLSVKSAVEPLKRRIRSVNRLN
jgi:hypothetical protein